MSSISARSLWHSDNTHSEILAEEIFMPADGLMIRSDYSLISLGTELLISKGLVPETQRLQMAVPNMTGGLALPVKYGYSLVGREMQSGEAYHIMHPHQDHCVVMGDSAYPIPPDVPLKRAVLASNVETALNAIWDAQLQPGQSVLIIGFGMIGSLIARLASLIAKVDPVVVEINPVRKKIAADLGFEAVDSALPGTFSVAFHSSATSQGLQSAIDAVGHEGKVVELSWYGSRRVELFLGGDFHYGRKQIISSQVSSIPGHMQQEWDFRKRKDMVFSLLGESAFDDHLTHEISLSEAAERFNQWRLKPPDGLGYVIKY